MLTAIENSFSKYCDDHNVFELTVDDFLSNNSYTIHINKFPCINHRSEILTSILTYYVTMRIRQYTLIANKDQKKINAIKKKNAKLVNT